MREGDEADPAVTQRQPAKIPNPSDPIGTAAAETHEWTKKTTIGCPQARAESIGAFWNRLNGAYSLQIKVKARGGSTCLRLWGWVKGGGRKISGARRANRVVEEILEEILDWHPSPPIPLSPLRSCKHVVTESCKISWINW